MKKILLITVTLLTVSASIYAAQGKGYREYGEETYSTPGSNFHMEEVEPGTAERMIENKKYTE